MKITIAICTWNRSQLLRQTLSGLTDLVMPEGCELEVQVINNNCTDNTDEVVRKFSGRLPIRLLHEPEPGLSNARNKAIGEATGTYIIWTDDDVMVDKNWLAAYVNAFEEYPDAAVFGGPIEPWFEGTPPDWLLNNWPILSSAYATRDLGNKHLALQVEGNQIPFGANYAVRMAEQKKYLYNPDLGLQQDDIILGEETQVVSSILIDGYSGQWIPEAKVKHWLPKSRQTLDYLKEYYFAWGRTLIICEPYDDDPQIFGRPRWLIRRIVEVQLKYFYKKLFGSENEKFEYFIRLWTTRGQLFG